MYRRGRGYTFEATLMRSECDLTEKLLSGRLRGHHGDMHVHMCECKPEECTVEPGEGLHLHSGSFRLLDAEAPENVGERPPRDDDDHDACEDELGAASRRGSAAPRRGDGGCDRDGHGSRGARVLAGRGGGLERPRGPTSHEAEATAKGLRSKLDEIRAEIDGEQPRPGPKAKAAAAGIVEAMTQNAVARRDAARPGRVPGPRPGERAGPGITDAAVGESPADADASFRVAPTRGEEDIVAFARNHPGQLLALAIEQIDGFLSAREGAGATPGAIQGASRFVAYLTTILHAAHPPSECGDWADELRTICETLDAMTGGDLGRAGDLLTQRLKSVSMRVAGESATMARQHELIPRSRASLASPSEDLMAGRNEIFRSKLEELRKKKSSG